MFNDTYLKLTYMFNPDKDFREQFRWVFKQLKSAYSRDDRSSHFYHLNEGRLIIPDHIKDEDLTPKGKDTTLIEKIKAIIN